MKVLALWDIVSSITETVIRTRGQLKTSSQDYEMIQQLVEHQTSKLIDLNLISIKCNGKSYLEHDKEITHMNRKKRPNSSIMTVET